MNNPEAVKPYKIARPYYITRRIERAIADRYPMEVRNKPNLEMANAFLRKGVGVTVVANHLSEREPAQIPAGILFEDPEMNSRHLDFPVNREHKSLKIDVPSRLSDSRPHYIETKKEKPDHELNEAEKAERRRNEEQSRADYNNYLKAILENYRRGGMSFLFPQGTRRPKLYEAERPIPRSFEMLSLQAERAKVDFAVMFMGIDIPEIEDYEAVFEGIKDSKNPDLTYVYNIGPTYSIRKLLDMAGGDKKKIDQVVYAEIAKLVSERYLGDVPANQDLTLAKTS